MTAALDLLRRVNRGVATLCGLVLILTVAFVLYEITARAASVPHLGGADEIGGYVMAGVTAWGLSFALTERAHIRIDMAVARLRPLMRDIVDVASLASIAAVAVTVAIYGWRVVGQSLDAGSRANTPLETPLWWPQIAWWTGWAWFALTATLIAAIALGLAVRRRSDELRALAGTDETVEVHERPAAGPAT